MVGSRAIQRWKNDYLVGGIDNLLNYEKGKHKSNTNLLNKSLINSCSISCSMSY